MAKQENSASKSALTKVNGLENWLGGVYKNAPVLPEGARKWIANNVHWLALIGGILGLFSAWGLLQVVQYTDSVWYSMGTYSAVYGGGDYRALIWVSLVVTVAQSVLLLAAYSSLKAHRKSGWNYLFYSSLLSVVTLVAYLFMAGNGLGSAFGSLLGMAVSFYLLFQIREYFKKA